MRIYEIETAGRPVYNVVVKTDGGLSLELGEVFWALDGKRVRVTIDYD